MRSSASLAVVMADDHNVMRTGLRMLLDAEQDMEEDPIFIREAMSAGAHSYVLKARRRTQAG
jgi:hypothetical protein